VTHYIYIYIYMCVCVCVYVRVFVCVCVLLYIRRKFNVIKLIERILELKRKKLDSYKVSKSVA